MRSKALEVEDKIEDEVRQPRQMKIAVMRKMIQQTLQGMGNHARGNGVGKGWIKTFRVSNTAVGKVIQERSTSTVTS